ncbi:hypothetical protein CEXT_416591 [Caerostris extrusa]|uniref:Uncharacterized protein n=1 Tax=Caerostris extrusa TaxID=172846 RepID=A0AAV4N6J9_CAEEX|nr:hypothetical protein CEXT_416591 [Caerostris extrusa]
MTKTVVRVRKACGVRRLNCFLAGKFNTQIVGYKIKAHRSLLRRLLLESVSQPASESTCSKSSEFLQCFGDCKHNFWRKQQQLKRIPGYFQTTDPNPFDGNKFFEKRTFEKLMIQTLKRRKLIVMLRDWRNETKDRLIYP